MCFKVLYIQYEHLTDYCFKVDLKTEWKRKTP